MSILVKSQHWFMNYGDMASAEFLCSMLRVFIRKEITKDVVETDIAQEQYEAIIFASGGQLCPYTEGDKYKLPVINSTCPKIFMGAGFNIDTAYNFNKSLWLKKVFEFLGQFDLIGLRTQKGVDMVSNELPDKQVMLCPDPLIFLGCDNDASIRNRVAISIYGTCFGTDDVIKALRSRAWSPEPLTIDVISHDRAFDLNRYACADFIITNRFHGAVMALAFAKPFIMLSSNIKHDFIANDLKCPVIIDYGEKLTSKDIDEFIRARDRHTRELKKIRDNQKCQFFKFMGRVYNLLEL